ncbi:methyl-accepting chemotaxis protein [Clostridium sp. YIM B02515]|uniref:Methyl-accepting chemotaxis protein n=1 Tax=Clostridium rhizosphaerae TaxID=2803861 RepID=A0ABS1TDS9_9CLOT|nr:methyl-accepting chemotaxis protein [Clostridium rhizosphaerae]MBL4936499.1 methyl-accepting chemotaxis protein [Clostridium rhizosphaerae]
MKIKSIRNKILLSVLPVFIVVIGVLVFLSYDRISALMNSQIKSDMQNQLATNVNEIEKRLQRHEKVAQGAAKTAEAASTVLSKDNYADFLKSIIATNDDTLGSGIWFEPYKYNSSNKFFGPYAYKDSGKIVYTDDYSKDDYNYIKYDWYKAGTTTNGTVWSDAYLDDVTKISMITTTVPFYDKNKQFLGVATADINLTTIQDMVKNIKVGEKGKAFIIDKNGTFIADKDTDKVMKVKISEDKNSSLSELGKTMLGNKSGQGTYKDESGNNIVYYSSVPETNWKIALSIPESELMAPVKKFVISMSLLTVISIAAVIALIVFFAFYLTKSINKVKDFAMAIAEGDLTKQIDIKTHDEIGKMAGYLNTMSQNMNDMVKEILAQSTEVASTSEELSASVEEMTAKLNIIEGSVRNIDDGIQELSSTTEEITASMEEVDSSINVLSGKAEDGSSLSNDIKNRAEKIQKNSKEASEKSELLYRDKQNKILQAVEDGKVVEKVKEMADIIDSIASQTNLLALNAAIEAARAGEQGKGFAVVADEVRKLAEQSTQAVSNIKDTIAKVKDAFDNLSDNTQEVVSYIDSTVKLDYEAMVGVGNQYGSDAQYINTMSEEIAAMSEEITATVSQVSTAVQNVASTTQHSAESTTEILNSVKETTAAMNEVAHSAETQAELAQKLNDIVRKFKVK